METDVKPINGPTKYSFKLNDLKEIILTNWPPSYVFNKYPNLKTDWGKAELEAEKRKDYLYNKNIWSPYPILSFCLGAAEINNSILHLRYFLFPTKSPEHQGHAVAQVIFETPINSSINKIEKNWVDALRENELSADNLIQIKKAELIQLNDEKYS